MSDFDTWKDEAAAEWQKVQDEEAKLVKDIEAHYTKLSDELNQSAIDARGDGVPKVHPDHQESYQPPTPAFIGDPAVGPGPVAVLDTTTAAPEVVGVGQVTVENASTGDGVITPAQVGADPAIPGNSATGTPVVGAPDSNPQPGTPAVSPFSGPISVQEPVESDEEKSEPSDESVVPYGSTE